jgi:C4-dicarboxylate-specific signal transduction histidine kinase
VLIDIDAQKRAEHTLEELRGRLQRASQSAMVAELAASIAHEINQPLTAVVSNGQACANWLAQEPPRLDQARHSAARVVSEGSRAGEIVARLRALFKLGPPNRASLSMNEVISEVLELTRSEVQRRRVLVRAELDRSQPNVAVDRVQMQQVVLNLVNNALDAMDENGARPKLLVLRSIQSGGGIVVEVSDTGAGIDDPGRVFDAFFTTKSHGMGVGLTISRSIVEAHGGRISANQVEPHGASFRVELPLESPA